MKKKSLILLPLLVLGSTGLSMLVTSCDKPVKSIEIAGEEEITIHLGKTAFLPEVTVLPEKAADKTYTVVTSASNIASVTYDDVEENYVITAEGVGEATISVISKSNNEIKDTLKVVVPQPRAIPTPEAITIEDLLAKDTSELEKVYQVTGYVRSVDPTDVFGNMYLATADDKKAIQVYGSTNAASSIKWNDAETELKFSNPRDFVSSGLAKKVHVGDKITMNCVYVAYGDQKKDEIMGYVLEDKIVKGETEKDKTITISKKDASYKFVDADGEEVKPDLTKLYWGQELLISAKAEFADKYDAVVYVNGKEAPRDDNGNFIVKVSPNLIVQVTDKKKSKGIYQMNATHFGLKGGYNNTIGSIGDLKLETFQTMLSDEGAIQMRKNKKGEHELSNVYNTTATDGNIKEVSVTFDKQKLGKDFEYNSEVLNLIVSKNPVALSATGLPTIEEATMEVKPVHYTSGSKQFTVTYQFEASKGYKYFDLTHIDDKEGTAYISSIDVKTDKYGETGEKVADVMLTQHVSAEKSQSVALYELKAHNYSDVKYDGKVKIEALDLKAEHILKMEGFAVDGQPVEATPVVVEGKTVAWEVPVVLEADAEKIITCEYYIDGFGVNSNFALQASTTNDKSAKLEVAIASESIDIHQEYNPTTKKYSITLKNNSSWATWDYFLNLTFREANHDGKIKFSNWKVGEHVLTDEEAYTRGDFDKWSLRVKAAPKQTVTLVADTLITPENYDIDCMVLGLKASAPFKFCHKDNTFIYGNGSEVAPYYVSSLAEYKALGNLVTTGNEVIYAKLANDIEVPAADFLTKDNLSTSGNKGLVTLKANIDLDMNGHKVVLGDSKGLTQFGDQHDNKENPEEVTATNVGSMLAVEGKVSVKIHGNGGFDCGNCDAIYNVYAKKGATVTIVDGTYIASTTCVQLGEGKVIIHGGTFGSSAAYVEANKDTPKAFDYIINVLDKYVTAGTASVEIDGGTFERFDPSIEHEGAGKPKYIVAGYEAKMSEVAGVKSYTVSKILEKTSVTNEINEKTVKITVKNTGVVDYNGKVTIDFFNKNNKYGNMKFKNFKVNGVSVTAKEIKSDRDLLGYELPVTLAVGEEAVITADITWNSEYAPGKTFQYKVKTENTESKAFSYKYEPAAKPAA